MLKKHIEEIIENGEVFIVETYTNDEGVVKGKAKYHKPSEVTPSEPTEQPKTQLDLIQEAVEKSNDELRQEGADALTEELIAMGII